MQLHELKPQQKKKPSARVGRGGKRGTYSGHGQKGQKARAGARIRPGFQGGSTPVWKAFPKQRGATKKVDVKHKTFSLTNGKPAVVNLDVINKHFNAGETVNPKSLVTKGLISSTKYGVKILSQGVLDKKLKFARVESSKAAREKIEKSGSVIAATE